MLQKVKGIMREQYTMVSVVEAKYSDPPKLRSVATTEKAGGRSQLQDSKKIFPSDFLKTVQNGTKNPRIDFSHQKPRGPFLSRGADYGQQLFLVVATYVNEDKKDDN